MLDFIIIGQGLAGSVLSYLLVKNNYSVKVFNREDPFSASRVSAGIFNPVTGKNLALTWQAENIFPFLNQFYPQMEQDIGCHFFYEKPVLRPFQSIREKNDFFLRQNEGLYRKFSCLGTYTPEHIAATEGSLITKYSGFLDVNTLLKGVKNFLIEQDSFVEGWVDFKEEVDITEDFIQIKKSLKCKRLIFCEGIDLKNNSLFNWLPLQPCKGQLLEIGLQGLSKKFIYNKSGFLIPRKEGTWVTGSTYERNIYNRDLTVEAREIITDKVMNLVTVPFDVIRQKSGIRPTSPDRRPIIGKHPVYENILLFNGLGTKGVSLAPYFASAFIQFLRSGQPLAKEVDIQRFYKNYKG